MKIRRTTLLVAALTTAAIGSSSAMISLSSANSFDTTTDDWVEGGASPNPPTHTANNSWDGNPGYLINTSDGSGQGGRFLMWNDSSNWTGDWTDAGVVGVSMWVDNRSGSLAGGSTTVPLRIALNGPGGWFMSNAISITDATVGSNEWQQIAFDIDAGNLSHVTGGSNDLGATLADVSRFEILVNASGTASQGGGGVLRGDNIVADLRFDDISTVGIPEPSTGALTSLALLTLLTRRKR